MVTWSVTIPTFYVVDAAPAAGRPRARPERVRQGADRLMAWVPLATIVSYAVILLLAQLEMNAVVNIWQTLFG